MQSGNVPKTDISAHTRKTLVIKIGGSCLNDGRSVKTVVERLKRLCKRGTIPVVVVSAPKGMTDALLELATNSHPREHTQAIDKILSEGEQLSIKILRSALESNGIRVKAFFPSELDFPLITDTRHCKANILLDETERRIRNIIPPILEKGVLPLIPGFVGRTAQGNVTTMGRGSSDTTAVAIGKMLQARKVILCKDVPGIFSGDPKRVSSPKQLTSITAEEAIDLGIKGAAVLYPFSLQYKSKDTEIRVVNFDSDNITAGGTEIIGELEENMKVTLDKQKKTAVTVIGNQMNEIPGLLTAFSTVLHQENINIFSVSASHFSICFYVNMEEEEKALRALHTVVMEQDRLTAVTSTSNISLITVMGRDFVLRPGILGAIGTALAGEDINIVDLSTSVCEADIFVASSDAEKAKHVLEGLF